MDSPLQILNAQIEVKLLQKLKEDYTVVLVTHTLRLAERLADNVIFIYLGEVIETGPAEQVFNNPKEERTREYVAGEIS